MMKPKFEQVLDYVKGGEDDPHVKLMLKHHPDGPEFLRQARLMYKMLRQQSEASDDDNDAEDFDVAASKSLRASQSVSVDALRDEGPGDDLFARLTRHDAEEQVSAISDLVSRATTRAEVLGVLVVDVQEAHVDLTYEPKRSTPKRPPASDKFGPNEPRTFYQSSLESLASGREQIDGII